MESGRMMGFQHWVVTWAGWPRSIARATQEIAQKNPDSNANRNGLIEMIVNGPVDDFGVIDSALTGDSIDGFSTFDEFFESLDGVMIAFAGGSGR
jgi:hypothetical protein